MKHKNILLYSVALIIIVILVGTSLSKRDNATITDEQLVSFDGVDGREEITRTQLDRRIAVLQLLHPQIGDILNSTPEMRVGLERQVLESMIDAALHRKAIKSRGLDINSDEIDTALESLVAYIYSSTSVTSLEDLTALGITEAALREHVAETTYSRALFDFFQGQLTEDRIREFWDENPNIKTVPAMVTFSHIIVATEPEATEIRTRIIAGEDFGDLAASLSIEPGADLSRGVRFAPPEQVGEPAIVAAVAALKIGETSPPVKTSLGWHIIRLVGRTEATELTFDGARNQIIGQVAHADFMGYVATLRETANIQNNMLAVPETEVGTK